MYKMTVSLEKYTNIGKIIYSVSKNNLAIIEV